MLDRQKLEAILANRFPGAAAAQLAAAANAIMGLADPRSAGRRRVPGPFRPFRALVDTSTTVSVSSRINAPIRRVFEMFTDLEHAAAHVSGIIEIEMLTPGPFRLGTRWRERRQILGRVDAADMEVTAFDRYGGYTISHHKGGVRIETVFSFEPEGDGTQATIEFALDGAGLPPGLLTPLNWAIAGKVRHVLNHDLADLKNCLEGPVLMAAGLSAHDA
jgi:uncharacterized protein YndB with AHSA1/START domain